MKPPARGPSFLYLASQSPRRAQLLQQIGVPFQTLLASVDEDAESLEQVNAGELPQPYVQRVARLKALAARSRLRRLGLPPALVLSADTTVALGRSILGKPQDHDHARHMLQSLAGRTHRVLTAVVLDDGVQLHTALSISHVRFARVTHEALEAYVTSGEPQGKAGAYAIQGAAAAFIMDIRGSHSGIMGLPLYPTAQLLRTRGWRD